MSTTAYQRIVVATAIASVLSGCAVSPGQISAAKGELEQQIAARKQAFEDRQRDLPLVEEIDANYLGSEAIPLSYNTTLPAVFHKQRLRLAERTSIKTIAERITALTRIPVVINVDVWARPTMRRYASSGSTATAAPSAQPAPTQAPSGGYPGGSPFANGAGVTTLSVGQQWVDPSYIPVDVDDYLARAMDSWTSSAGLSWDYNREKNEITVFRYVTRTFQVRTTNRTIETASQTSKGLTATSGTQGSANGSGASVGSFDAGAKVASSSKMDPLASLLQTIKDNYLLSSEEVATSNPATSTITVTGSRYTVDQVGTYLSNQNASLSLQALVTLDTYLVQVSDSSEGGIDVSAVYSKLANGAVDWALKLNGPTSLASNAAGQLGFNVVSPSSPWNGTSVTAQAVNSLGTVLSHTSRTYPTKNRVPINVTNFVSEGYLAQTTPGYGGISGSSQTGLTPGTVTTGSFSVITPTIYDNGMVELTLTLDESASHGFKEITTGQGATSQKIQTPNITGNKADPTIEVRDGDSMILVAMDDDDINGTKRYGIAGGSLIGQRTRVVKIQVVTPRILGRS